MGMVSDPDFQKLQLGDQRKALSGLDKTFGSLSDADFTRVLGNLKPAPSTTGIPGAPNGLPPVPGPPIPSGMQPEQTNYRNAPGAPLPAGTRLNPKTGLPMREGDPTGVGTLNVFPALGGAVGGAFGGTAGAALGGMAGEGLKQVAMPLASQSASANPPAEMLKSGAIMGAAEGIGKYALSPLVKWMSSSKTLGAKLLQQASAKAGSAPVELSPKTNELVDDLVQQSKLGGKPIKVISDLLDRVGPSTRQPAYGSPNPLTYDEARILQSNISQLTPEEMTTLKGTQKGLLKQLAGSFSSDVQAAADKAGVGTEHAAGMREYALASSRNRVLAKVGKAGAAAAGAAGIGAAGYEGYRAVKGMTP
jgi:hypothetical protein